MKRLIRRLQIAPTKESGTSHSSSHSSSRSMSSNQSRRGSKHGRMMQRTSFSLADHNRLIMLVNEKYPWYIVSPKGVTLRLWTCLILLLLVYVIVCLPLQIGWKTYFVPEIVANLVDGLFLLDVCLNFFVAIEKFDDAVDGHIKVVKDLPSIAQLYLAWWFWIDVVSSFPFDQCVPNAGNNEALFAALQGLKILKIGRSTRMIERLKLNGEFVMEFIKLAQIMKMMAIFLAFAHLNACLFWFVGSKVDKTGEPLPENAYDEYPSWITYGGYHILSPPKQYLTSLYFSLTSLTTVGFGDIYPHNGQEQGFVLYMYITGALVYACIFGFVTNTVQNMMKNAEMFRQRLESIEVFSALHGLPIDMEERMTGYIKYLWHHTKVMRNGIKQADVLADMPESMVTSVLMYLYAADVKKVPMFSQLDEGFIKQLVVHLEDCVCLADDFVFEKNDIGYNMFFIRDGKARVLAESPAKDGKTPTIEKVLAVMVRGSFFGEISLITGGKRSATIQAISNMEMFSLTKMVLDEIMSHYPEYQEIIYKAANRRIHRSASVEKKEAGLGPVEADKTPTSKPMNELKDSVSSPKNGGNAIKEPVIADGSTDISVKGGGEMMEDSKAEVNVEVVPRPSHIQTSHNQRTTVFVKGNSGNFGISNISKKSVSGALLGSLHISPPQTKDSDSHSNGHGHFHLSAHSAIAGVKGLLHHHHHDQHKHEKAGYDAAFLKEMQDIITEEFCRMQAGLDHRFERVEGYMDMILGDGTQIAASPQRSPRISDDV